MAEVEGNRQLAYKKPARVKVAEIIKGYGLDAAYERWSWITPRAIEQIAKEGREILRGRTGERKAGPRRITTPEQEEAIIAAAVAAGKVYDIGKPWGISVSLVRALFRERGLDYPKTPYAIRAARGQATRRERNASLPAQARTLIPYIGQEGSNVVSMLLSIRGPLPPSVAAKSADPEPTALSGARKGYFGIERKVPPDAVIREDFANGLSQRAMCDKYGVSSIAYHLKRLGLVGTNKGGRLPIAKVAAGPSYRGIPVAAPVEVTPHPVPVTPPAPVASPVAQRPVPLPEVEELDLMILAARIVSGAGCDASTAISIVRSWRS